MVRALKLKPGTTSIKAGRITKIAVHTAKLLNLDGTSIDPSSTSLQPEEKVSLVFPATEKFIILDIEVWLKLTLVVGRACPTRDCAIKSAVEPIPVKSYDSQDQLY